MKQLVDLGALKTILFSSLARDEVDIYSDLGLLVVMPAERSRKDWMKLIYDVVDSQVASDIVVYNEKEFRKSLPTSSFLKNVLSTGKMVYEKVL